MFLKPVVFASSLPSITRVDDGPEKKLCRRSELPIYPTKVPSESKSPIINSPLFDAVKYARIEGCKAMCSVRLIVDRCSKFVFTGIAHTKYNVDVTLDYLHEERNLLPRIAAIGVGALTGYILGLRRGYFKRLIYTTSSGLAIAAVCYPDEAKEYGNKGVRSARRYFIVGYHFCNGVSKDLIGFGLPSFPLRILSPDLEGFLKQDTDQSIPADSELYPNHNRTKK